MRNRKSLLTLGIALMVAGLSTGHWMTSSPPRGTAEAPRANSAVDSVERAPVRRTIQAHAVATPSAAAPSAVVREGGSAGSGPEDGAAAIAATRPFISAIRAAHTSLEEKRAAMLAALEESGAAGPEDGTWASQAGTVFDGWQRQMPASVLAGVVRGQPRCFHAGCAVDVEFASEDAYNEAARAFRSIAEPGAVHGGRVQTPAVATDRGRVIATWIMLQPSDRGHAQNPG